MRYADIERRVKALEAQAAARRPYGRIVIVEVVSREGHPLPADERERRIAQAQEEAGPEGLVMVVNLQRRGDEL